MNEHVKALFLGMMTAEKPLNFKMAMEEIQESEYSAAELETLWKEVESKKLVELQNFFAGPEDIREFIGLANEKLDQYLTGLVLAGTESENCNSEDKAALLDELEDVVIDLDELLADGVENTEEANEAKSMLIEAWGEYVKTL